jgi:low temperature requirement protein LtrA
VAEQELFGDLIVVAAIASLAHQLRYHYDGWPSIEAFTLLFAALHTSWRTVVSLFNSFGTGLAGDLLDKFCILLWIVSMSGIGLSAGSAFTSARIPAAICAFLATAIPSAAYGAFTVLEPVTRNPHNHFRQGVGFMCSWIAGVAPYLVACFVESERAVKNCYWVSLVLSLVLLPMFALVYRRLHLSRPKAMLHAVNVESQTEKYGIFSLIVMGESLMALLFEGSELLAGEGISHVVALFGAIFLSVAMLYSFMTLYYNVDNVYTRGAVHPLRRHRWTAMSWSYTHFFYHLTLAGFISTGVGLALRDIAAPPPPSSSGTARMIDSLSLATAETVEAVVETSAAQFNNSARWLFASAWLAATMLSGVMGLLWFAGPRGKTKDNRIWLRAFLSLPLAVGMPFASVSALTFLAVFSAASSLLAVSECILIEMDRLGMLRSLGTDASLTSGAQSSQNTAFDSSAERDGDWDEAERSEWKDPEDDGAVRTEEGVPLTEADAQTAELLSEAGKEAARRGEQYPCRFEAVCNFGSRGKRGDRGDRE